MKKNLKIFSIIFLILLLIVAIASFSWFENIDSVSVNSSENVHIKVGKNIEISDHYGKNDKGEQVWTGELSKTYSDSVLDCSGDGKTFFAPDKLDENDQPNAELKEVSGSEYIIDTYLDVRTTDKNIDLYLGSKSFINPVEGINSIFAPEDNPYLAGNIAGCVRVAFFEVTYDDADKAVVGEPICVWAPNSNIQYDAENNTVTTSGNREAEYKYYTSTALDGTKEYSKDDIISGKLVLAEKEKLCTADEKPAEYNIGHSPKLLSFDGGDNYNYPKHLLIRVWFEGTDREANSVFNSGMVNFNFSFIGVTPKSSGQHTEEDIEKLDALALSGNNEINVAEGDYGKFVYSTDGIDWSPLSNGTFNADEKRAGVYVALAETNKSTVGRTLQDASNPTAYHDVRLIKG